MIVNSGVTGYTLPKMALINLNRGVIGASLNWQPELILFKDDFFYFHRSGKIFMIYVTSVENKNLKVSDCSVNLDEAHIVINTPASKFAHAISYKLFYLHCDLLVDSLLFIPDKLILSHSYPSN